MVGGQKDCSMRHSHSSYERFLPTIAVWLTRRANELPSDFRWHFQSTTTAPTSDFGTSSAFGK
jgi:hypothetical protein